MEKHTCDITGDVFIAFKATIAKNRTSFDGKQIFESVRKFLYQGNKVGLNISLLAPTTIGKRTKVRPVDLVCFSDQEFPKIIKMGLSEGDKVEVFARQTERGLVLEEANDIIKVKSI